MSFDVIVVGARCAGAATALLLARSGARVLVLDRGRAGTDTLSTHGLARPAVMQLHRWGVLDRIRAAGTPTITSTVFHYGADLVPVEVRPADGIDGLYNPRRWLLDAVLVDAARDAGAEVRHGHSVTGVVRDQDGTVSGVTVRRAGGKDDVLQASLVIGADGRGSRVARAVGAPVTWSGFGSGLIEYRYWSGLSRHTNHFYYRPGVSAGVFPTNGDAACVFVGTTSGRLPALPRDPEARFLQLLTEAAPGLARCLARRDPVSSGRSFSGLAGWMRRPWGAGWALVGDAGYFKDPLTAHGITDALVHAELLTQAVVAGGTPAELRAYEQQRDALSTDFAETTDEVAAYGWDLPRLRQLHRAAADATREEVRLLRHPAALRHALT
jgi:2-polyprenyl-6-methoxyphenol hydroxylase-like FAD-dependent oxidoreductase